MAILNTLRHYDKPRRTGSIIERPLWETRALVTHVVCLEGAKVDIDETLIVSFQPELANIRQWVYESSACAKSAWSADRLDAIVQPASGGMGDEANPAGFAIG